MADPKQIAQAFVQHYYQTFDTARQNLAGLYHAEQSMLSYEGKDFKGTQAIMTHLTAGLTFKTIQHQVTSMDVQPSLANNGILVVVCGHLVVDGNAPDKPLKFSQTFHLIPTAANSFFILNDIFRLIYG
eukprot:TRINITY_DN11023_c0_g1_i1.p1 TRINITY_DN11023_c0_g1~~TRINITY_DN11023_c0_g1_i1.p1  ORF type:complete len:129 (+),score=35.37 TRINITY_DN11023_c0_g1_i1:78-464(+)